MPPLRPIISGSGSITEAISHYVQDQIKDISKRHPSYLEDTPDFLRFLKDIGDLPDGAILATVDVSALYSNIQREDAVEAVRKALETRVDKTVPASFILELLDLVLKYNVFKFDRQLFLQLIGTAMGTRAAPNIADIFMSYLDIDIIEAAKKYSVNGVSPLVCYKRFLDDIFMVWLGTHAQLHSFHRDINKIKSSIKFTMEHTKKPSDNDPDSCPCPTQDNIPFLDTSLSVRAGSINSDLYRKKTDRCQYLLPSSCHPPHCTDNIPYSLALRIQRICTDTGERNQRMSELREMLLSRGYKKKLIDKNIEKALLVPPDECIKKVVRKKEMDRVVFSVMYHPALPSIPRIIAKAYRTMVESDPRLKEVFKKPPMVAYRRPPSLREKLIRAKVPPPPDPNARPKRECKGMRKCGNCSTCDFVQEGKVVKSTMTNVVATINAAVNCRDARVIYCITCKKPRCRQQYTGKTVSEFRTRMYQHRVSVTGTDGKTGPNLDKAVGAHFNGPGHKVSDMAVTILEKCKVQSW